MLKMKTFPWVERNDPGHKNSFFFKLNPFSGGNARIRRLVPFFRGKFYDVISPEIEKLPESTFPSMLLCKVSFQSIDGNRDFWHPDL